MKFKFAKSTFAIFLTFTAILSINPNILFSQSLFEDLLFISKNSKGNLDTTDYSGTIKRISKYLDFEPGAIVNNEAIISKISNNPYLYDIWNTIIKNREKAIEGLPIPEFKEQDQIKSLVEKINALNSLIIKVNNFKINITPDTVLNFDNLKKNFFEKELNVTSDLNTLFSNFEFLENGPIYSLLDKITEKLNQEIGSNQNKITRIQESYKEEIEKFEKNKRELKSMSNSFKDQLISQQTNISYSHRNSSYSHRIVGTTSPTTFGSFNFTVNGMNQNSLVDGTAIFIAKRIKEELILAYYDRFKNFFYQSSKYKLDKIFPETYKFVTLDKNLNNINLISYSSLFKSTFKDDLNKAIFRIPNLIDDPDYIENPELNFIYYFIKSLEKISNGENPAKVIFDFSTFPPKENATSTAIKFNRTVQYLNVVSESFYEESSFDNIWLNEEKYIKIFSNEFTIKIFLGIIFQKLEKINPENSFLIEKLKDVKLFNKLINDFYQIAHKTEEINGFFRKKRKDGDKLEVKDLILFHYAVNDLIFYALGEFDPDFSASKGETLINKYLSISNEIYELYSFGISNDYSQILIHLYKILDEYYLKEQLKSDYQFEFLKYTNFMAEVAGTTSSEELSKVFESIALPPGSYSIKRRYIRSTSINAYPGLLAGVEFPNGQLNPKPITGFTAPIGVSFNWATKCFHSNSIFVSIFDLGAPVLFRLSNSADSGGLPQEVRIAQFVAPGVSWVHGFRNTPFSMILGTQFTPQIRTFDMTKQAASVFRINLGIVLDLHLFNIHTSKNFREN